MEDRNANIIAGSLVIILIAVVTIARIFLKLSKSFFLIAGADIAAILAVFACYFIRRRLNHRRRLMETKLALEGKELRIEYSFLRKIAGVPTKFRYKEIEEATNNFQSLIGRGASASVFKGILKDGTEVAVKRIEGEDRGEKEFRSEIAAIASVQHVNLVRLFGYCSASTNLRFLVYSFIPNGSLDKWIFPKNCHEQCLSWSQRFQVAIDIAKALTYLHQDCRSRVLHLDVKPENILLDENYRAVVADFGLSKLMGRDESRVLTTLRGTKGYLAPEWLLELGVTEKSDVFSYGMVLLEIIGGRRNVTVIGNGVGKSKKKFQYFPKIVNEKLREGKVMDVVDKRLLELGEEIEESEVRRLICVALWCVQEKARRRPSMRQVVEWLEGRGAAVEKPPETPMIVVDLLSIDDEEDGQQMRPRVIGRLASQMVDRCIPSSSRSYSFSLSMVSPR